MRDFSRELTNLETGLRIDEHRLDDALVAQPELYWKVAKLHAIAVSDLDAAKKQQADTEAEVDIETRTIAKNRADKTVREKEIESIKRKDPRVESCTRKTYNRKQEMMLLDALKDAFSMRSSALKGLVQLHIAGYFEEASQDKVQKVRRIERLDRHRQEIANRYSNL
jgi:hypothetical protein